MRREQKRWSCRILLSLLAVMLTGCGVTDEAVRDEPETLTPITDTFSVWTVDNQTMTPGYENTATARLMEEATGIRLDVTWVTAAEAQEKFSLMIASGDVADVVTRGVSSYYNGGAVQAVHDGLFQEVTELIPQYMPHYQAILEENEYLKKDILSDDGRMYSLWAFICDADLNPAESLSIVGPAIRRDWLDRAGLDSPVTIDDWTEVLTAFRDMGVEAPLMIGSNGRLSSGAFLSAYGILEDFYLEGEQVLYGPVQEGYRRYLEQMSQWYETGLIDPDFMSNDGYGMLDPAVMSSDRTGAGQIYWIFGGDEMAVMGYEVEEEFFWENTTLPVLNEGDIPQSAVATSCLEFDMCISAEVTGKRLETLCRYLDFMYTKEAFEYRNMGEEGVHWIVNDQGEYQYTDMIFTNEVYDSAMMGILTKNNVATAGLQMGHRAAIALSHPSGHVSLEMQSAWTSASTELRYPSQATMTQKETESFSARYTAIATRVDEMTVRYIAGVESLDTFDAFVAELYEMGLQECIDHKQAALDRYHAR